MNTALNWLLVNTANPRVGDEWAVLALARANIQADEFFDSYLEALRAELAAGHPSLTRWTDFQRVTLAVTALGLDATNFHGFNLISGFSSFIPTSQRQTLNRTIMADIFAIIALNSRPYGGDTALYINALLDAETSAGGWGLGTAPNLSITAMTIQALAPFYSSDARVRAAVDRALTWLDGQTITDAESNVQVIVALTALGHNPQRFVDALLTFRDPSTGGFLRGTSVNRMTTEQAAYALVAFTRFAEGRNTLYDMRDAGRGTIPPPTGGVPIPTPSVVTNPQPGQGRAHISVRDDNARPGQTRNYFEGYFDLNQDESAYSLLRRTALGIVSTGTPERGMYVVSINGFGEFDEGPLSGWVFRVNGFTPTTSSSHYMLRDGDMLEWLYTRDLGRDLQVGVLGTITTPDIDRATVGDEETDRVTETGPTDPQLITATPNVMSDIFSTIVFPDGWNNPFVDVTSNNWFYRYVRFAFTNNLMFGVSDNQFAPNMNLSRAMIVAILWRLTDSPDVAGNTSFADVRQGQWYTEAINWAYSEGIVSGFGDGRFGPSDNVTREQLALILLNYARYHDLNIDINTFSTTFADVNDVSSWALDAMIWANSLEIIVGRSPTTLVPGGTATRAESSAMIHRFIEHAGESAIPIHMGSDEVDPQPTEADPQPATDSQAHDLDAIVADAAATVLRTVPNPVVGTIGGEWAVFGLARSGYNVPGSFFTDYLREVEQLIRERGGILDERRFTEYSRIILALTAAGFDPRNVAGHNLLTPLADFDQTIWQGINGPIFALLALDSLDYVMPTNSAVRTQATREMYVNEILRRQLNDGGWNLTAGAAGEVDPSETADINLTGMALQALAKYQDHPGVRDAIDRALAFLSRTQRPNGGFTSVESAVQVLVAISELGISYNDSRFVKNGNTIVDNILTFRNQDGSFRHSPGSTEGSLMSTEQALYGLTAARRTAQGQNSLYRMSDRTRR